MCPTEAGHYTSCGTMAGTRKEMFYLLMHSTPLYSVRHMVKDLLLRGNVLFNDALNTFYSWLYGVSATKRNNK